MLFLARWGITLSIALVGDDNLRFIRFRRFDITERFKNRKIRISTKPSPQNTFYFSKWCQIKQKKFEHTIGACWKGRNHKNICSPSCVSSETLDLNNLSLQINKVCISYSVHTSCLHLGWSYCKGSRCLVLNVHILEIVAPTKRLDIYFKVKFICLRIKSSFILKVLLKLGGFNIVRVNYRWYTLLWVTLVSTFYTCR